MSKKVKNATPLEYNGIKFKSKLEVNIYKTLEEHGYTVQYEPTRYVLWKGFKPVNHLFYTRDDKTGLLQPQYKKIMDITYTPDFTFEIGDYKIIIEAKGKANDVYPYKRKLFRAYIEEWNKTHPHNQILYFEVYSKKNALQVVEIIKAYDIVRKN